MGVDGSVTAVYEEAELAKSAAVSYKLIDVSVCNGRACALERKVCKVAAKGILNSSRKCLNTLVILKVNVFDNLPQADVIVSNPPYIRSDEIPSLQSEVLREPVMALDGGDDGLVFYRVLVNEWSEKLKSDGFMAFECGEDQAQDICDLFSEINFDSKVVYDYNNIQRIVTGRRKKQ